MPDLPDDAADEAERLTRLARRTSGGEAETYRRERDRLLAEHGFVARVRGEGARDVLVCYPEEWIGDGVVRTERIDDLGRAVERPLSGPADDETWAAVDAHNREVVAAVEERAGPVHARNVAALADFLGNHYVRRIEEATAAEVREFVGEYFPRNAWPTDEQRDALPESLRLAFEAAGRSPPDVLDAGER